MSLRVALAQLEPIPASIESNLNKIYRVVTEYQADLYVFPELFLTGYTSRDLLYRISQELTSNVIARLRILAREHRIGIVVGLSEKSSYGFLYNSLIAIDDRGEVHVYRKRHLPTFSVFDEARWFRSYRGYVKPWSFRGVKVGFGICYDIFFPEIFKSQVLQGAKILIAISASPDSSVPLFHTLIRARALENTVFFIWVNMVGFFDGLGFGGSSVVVDPLGNVVEQLKPFEEDVRMVNIDLSLVDRARIDRPVIRDSSIEDAYLLLESYRYLESQV